MINTPSSSVDVNTSTRRNVAFTEEGFSDFKNFPERTYVKTLKPYQQNLFLFGRIEAMDATVWIWYQTADVFRNLLQVMGSSQIDFLLDSWMKQVHFNEWMTSEGNIDITLWDSVGSSFSKSQPGQLVFLEGVSTTEEKSNGSFFANCSAIHNSKFINGKVIQWNSFFIVSCMGGLLNTPSICKIVKLIEAKQYGYKNFVVRAAITNWQPLYSSFCYPVRILSISILISSFTIEDKVCKRYIVKQEDNSMK